MSTPEKISPDDPRLTAYALGELEPAERAEFELRLQHDPAARALVDEIAGTARSIGEALAQEPLPETSAPDLSAGRNPVGKPVRRSGLGKLLEFPYLYYTISGTAAACFAVAFVLWQEAYNARSQVRITAVDLTGFKPAAPVAGEAPTGDFVTAKTNPVSRFPAVLGSATAFEELKDQIMGGRRPDAGSVRIEALVNYFAYQYGAPGAGKGAFAAHLEVAESPWSPAHRLVRIGLKGRVLTADGALPVIARDLSVQVAFNPEVVQAYRLIGFEKQSDSSGPVSGATTASAEIRSGHAVTALYEIVPSGQSVRNEAGTASPKPVVALSDDLLVVKLQYRLPEGGPALLADFPLRDGGGSFAQASADFKFAASVAAFGMILRDSPHKGSATLSQVEDWAESGLGDDPGGHRREFIGLTQAAKRLLAN